jgi:RHS repeat-associated protein
MSVNRLTAGGQNVATDVKGNITTLPVNLRPAGSTTAMNLNWDSDNKLRSADIDANGTADVNFQYDALGRRVARSGTGGSVVFVQMDQQTIADYPVGGAATTPTFRYVYASYIDEPVVRKTAGTGGTLVYFHCNHQYSITAITTSTGTIAERYAYTAYGQPTILDASASVLSSSAINNRYTYTAREWDATLGLHHSRERWMSPIMGRFLSRDPIGYKQSDVILYEFLNAKTLGMLDPMGESAVKVVGGCVIVVALYAGGCAYYKSQFDQGTRTPNPIEAKCLDDLWSLVRPGYCKKSKITIDPALTSPMTKCHPFCFITGIYFGPVDVDCTTCTGSINTLLSVLHECYHEQHQGCQHSSSQCGEYSATARSVIEIMRNPNSLCSKLVALGYCTSRTACITALTTVVNTEAAAKAMYHAGCVKESGRNNPQF